MTLTQYHGMSKLVCIGRKLGAHVVWSVAPCSYRGWNSKELTPNVRSLLETQLLLEARNIRQNQFLGGPTLQAANAGPTLCLAQKHLSTLSRGQTGFWFTI